MSCHISEIGVVTIVPIYLVTGSFQDPLPDSLITRKAFFSSSCDLVAPGVLLNFIVDGSSHPHPLVYVPNGALDAVDG